MHECGIKWFFLWPKRQCNVTYVLRYMQDDIIHRGCPEKSRAIKRRRGYVSKQLWLSYRTQGEKVVPEDRVVCLLEK